MRDLISKEKLIKAIVNTPTNNQANPLQGYLDGIATRQLEIIDIINEQPAVSDREIRDKAIEEFVMKTKNFVDCGYLCSQTELRWSDLSVCKMIEEIAEQMKEVEE